MTAELVTFADFCRRRRVVETSLREAIVTAPRDFRVGDRVRIRSSRETGTIESAWVTGKILRVLVRTPRAGIMCALGNIEPAEEAAQDLPGGAA